jgi:hypothetical protein
VIQYEFQFGYGIFPRRGCFHVQFVYTCTQFYAYGSEEVTKDKFEGMLARLEQRDGGAGKLEGKADKEADPCWRLLPRRIGEIEDSQRKPFRVFIRGRRQDPIAASPTQRIG